MSKDTTLISKRSGTFGLRRICMLAAVMGALASATALAGSKLQTVEECLETGTDMVSLPGVPGGMLSAKACTACETHQLTFNQNTRYFIGQQAVSYARLRAAIGKGSTRLDLFYRPDNRVLTRVRLAASADANKQ
jgi:hypothetical protein